MAKQDAKAAKPDEPAISFPGQGLQSQFVNQFYVIVGPGFSRLALGEQVSTEPPVLSAAFTIPTGVAKEMAETILRIIAEQTPAWEAAAKAQEAAKGETV